MPEARCRDCGGLTLDLAFHQEMQCRARRIPGGAGTAQGREALRKEYALYFWQRGEDFDHEMSRTTKANRRRARFHRDASFAAARALSK